MHQHDVRLFEGGVRATRAHRHAHVSRGETGCVVHAIAHHRHRLSIQSEASDDLDLLFRFQFGTNVIEFEFGFQIFGGRAPVAS
jgi:hypothetical protein